jgi:hypothetical protein
LFPPKITLEGSTGDVLGDISGDELSSCLTRYAGFSTFAWTNGLSKRFVLILSETLSAGGLNGFVNAALANGFYDVLKGFSDLTALANGLAGFVVRGLLEPNG